MEKYRIVQISPNTWTIYGDDFITKAASLTIIADSKEEAIDILVKCGYNRETLI